MGLSFVPCLNNLVVVFGQQGLVIWKLFGIENFFQVNLLKQRSVKSGERMYEDVFKREGEYLDIKFSNKANLMACIKKEEFNKQMTYVELISLDHNLEVVRDLRIGQPAYLSFSPADNFLLIGH